LSAGFVVDASVGFSWVYRDQATPETDQLLVEVESGIPVTVPSLWFLEMANTLLIAERRHKINAMERKAAVNRLRALQFVVDGEAMQSAFDHITDLAQKHGLSIYDAVYLELALRQNMPLASRDAALRKACERCSLKVI
jgi:predicted nucleic acid-binding protein